MDGQVRLSPVELGLLLGDIELIRHEGRHGSESPIGDGSCEWGGVECPE